VWLDAVAPVRARVGYGSLGALGSLGYEGKSVCVGGRHYEHALSSHPPAVITYSLRGRFSRFSALVALNDDVPAGSTHADFFVHADRRQIASATNVAPGEPPRPLTVRVTDARVLELSIRTRQWEHCHAVWLDPAIELASERTDAAAITDCLGRTDIHVPEAMPPAERCVATIVSPGFEWLMDDLLGSLRANGGCADARLIVMAVDRTAECRRIAAAHGAVVIECGPKARINPTVKAALYTLPALVDADKFLCLDADMLVVGSLAPIFDMLDACPESAVLAGREANGRGLRDLAHALSCVYGGRPSDLARLVGRSNGEAAYPLVINDGIFAGTRRALRAVDGVIRSWPSAATWVDERHDIWWRNQFIFNLALAKLRCGVALDATYNLQLDSQDVDISGRGQSLHASWNGQAVRILHFNGRGRHKYPQWRGRFRVSR
jgi:NPCBM/NEW2 domain